jgi:hypothetical protein
MGGRDVATQVSTCASQASRPQPIMGACRDLGSQVRWPRAGARRYTTAPRVRSDRILYMSNMVVAHQPDVVGRSPTFSFLGCSLAKHLLVCG